MDKRRCTAFTVTPQHVGPSAPVTGACTCGATLSGSLASLDRFVATHFLDGERLDVRLEDRPDGVIVSHLTRLARRIPDAVFAPLTA